MLVIIKSCVWKGGEIMESVVYDNRRSNLQLCLEIKKKAIKNWFVVGSLSFYAYFTYGNFKILTKLCSSIIVLLCFYPHSYFVGNMLLITKILGNYFLGVLYILFSFVFSTVWPITPIDNKKNSLFFKNISVYIFKTLTIFTISIFIF